MIAKKIAALVVAALVAGAVMGTLGIANADDAVVAPAATTATGTACQNKMDGAGCGDCTQSQACAPKAASTQGCPKAAGKTEGACGTGACQMAQ